MFFCQKKITAFLLVLLLAIPLIFSVVLTVQQKVLQVSSRFKFDKEIIQTISVHKKDINWVKKGKEILIDGKYFDVKSFKTRGDDLLLTGYYDHKEDNLVGKIKRLFQQKDKSESPVNQTAVKFIFFPAFTNHAEISYETKWHFVAIQYYSFDETLPPAPCLDFTQPPKIHLL